MKQNIGGIDRVIRLLVAAVIGFLYFTNRISGSAAVLLLVVAIVFALTSLISTCPLYAVFGIKTKQQKS